MSLDNTHHVTNYNPSHWLELYVPQNVVHLTYVPQVPQVWYTCGTEYSPPLDGDKFTDFWIDLMKI